jgi:hypothetical protein
MFVEPYHEGIFFQIYKPHWYNHTLEGVHIECGIGAETLKNRSLALELHVGHRNLFDRERFNEITLPAMRELVSSWGSGCQLSATHLSSRLHADVPFTRTGFADQLAAELTRWSGLGRSSTTGSRASDRPCGHRSTPEYAGSAPGGKPPAEIRHPLRLHLSIAGDNFCALTIGPTSRSGRCDTRF